MPATGGASSVNTTTDGGVADARIDTRPESDAACGGLCSDAMPICDFVAKSCRAPVTCDLCNVDADCAGVGRCLEVMGQRMCVGDGTSCQSGGYCCTVDLAAGGHSISSCNPNFSCKEPTGATALPPRGTADAGGDAGPSPTPECFLCDHDTECDTGLVCGVPVAGISLYFCVPPNRRRECCLGPICWVVDGANHVP